MNDVASFDAFGGRVVVAVAEAGCIAVARRLAIAEAQAFDRACSRFRTDSELTRLNQAAGQMVRVGPLLAAAIEVALRAASVSDGLVDLTIGDAVVAAGYDRDFAEVSSAPSLPTPHPGCQGWQSVMFDPSRSAVRLAPGTAIDLGATGKALFADRAARLIFEHTGSGALVGAGGDIAVAGPPPAGGWLVGLAEHHAGHPDSAVFIDHGGVATSGTTARTWKRGDCGYHHILDPRTGRPAATCWRTVTVAGASAVDANIAATAAVILGADALAWLDVQRLPALLVDIDGGQARTCGWPGAEDRAYSSLVA